MLKQSALGAFLIVAGITAEHAAAAPQVTAATLAAAPSGSGYCPSVPSSSTGFLTTDSQAWFVFTYTGGSAGDQYAVQWLDPSNAVYTTFGFTQAATGGNYCYQYFINIAGAQPAAHPGTWHAQLLWNSTVVATLAFTISPPVNCTNFSVASGTAQNWFVAGNVTNASWAFVASPSNCNWKITNYSGIIISASPSSGLGSATISANFPVNTTSNIQTGTVTIASGSVSFVFYVTQNPSSCRFTASPSGFTNVPAAGAPGGSSTAPLSLTITASPNTCGWFLGSQQSWIQLPTGEQIGTQTVSVVVSANNTGATRSGSITTCCSSSDISISVVQLATSPPTLTVSPSSVSGSGSIGASVNLTPSSLVSVGSTSTPITFSVSTKTNNAVGPNWLNVTVVSGQAGSATGIPPNPASREIVPANTGSGSTPAGLSISANLQGLAPGTYTGTITVTPTSATSNGAQIINITVTAFGQDNLQFTYSPVVNQALQLTSSSALSTNIQVTAADTTLPGMYFNASATVLSPPGGSWLTIKQNGAQTNTTVSVSAQLGNLGQGTYNGRVDFLDSNNNPSSVAVVLVVQSNANVTTSSSFIPVTPCRIADTRNPAAPFGGPSIGAGTTRSFSIPNGPCSIPAAATAFSLNVTVVPHGSLGYLTLWPSGQSQPMVSTMNSFDGRVKANAAIVPAGANGAVSVYATDTTDVILDINGYFVPVGSDPAALAFYPVSPCRVADTRNPAAPLGGPSLAAATTRAFSILTSPCGVPSTAHAYALNFTVVPQTGLGYLTAWPYGLPQPPASTLNDPTGAVTANSVIVPAGGSGATDVFTTDNTDLLIDITGYFAPPGPGGLWLYTMPPCRALDTRQAPGSPIESTLSVFLPTSPCPVPVSAQAYLFNATVIPAGFLGFITLWPQGQLQPPASTLNATDGAVTSNMAIVPSGGGFILAFPSNPTHLILDISGYFAP